MCPDSIHHLEMLVNGEGKVFYGIVRLLNILHTPESSFYLRLDSNVVNTCVHFIILFELMHIYAFTLGQIDFS